MEQSLANNGVIAGKVLTYKQDGREITIPLDSPAWYAWLEEATTFSFREDEGSFTAHKARASSGRGGWYWYAYRHWQGKLRRRYLGVSAKLTRAHLCEAARKLAATTEQTSTIETVQSPPLPVRTTPPTATHILPILTTKLYPPRLPVQHVARPQLLSLLDQVEHYILTMISAPAGMGKTTLLAAWARTTSHPVAWLALESADNDPQRFLVYLIAALARLDERIASIILPPLHAPHAPHHPLNIEYWLTLLLNELVRLLQTDVVLILDDADIITEKETRNALQFLLDHAPEHLHLIIGVRADPPLALPRLRAHNQLSEIRTEQLRFAHVEMQAVVQAMGLALTEDMLHTLEQRTQGWIVGVQLLALALRGHADPTTLLYQSSGSHHFLLDYVSDEILAQQPSEIRTFLLYTSVLDRMTGELCTAVTMLPGGQERLAALYQANLLLNALDETGTWYTYHPLFAEALRTHLQKLDHTLTPELYRRASNWYEQQHRYEEACDYALRAGDLPHAATLLTDLLPQMIEQGKFIRLLHWLDQIPPELTTTIPQIYLAANWLQPLRTRTPINTEMIIEHLQQQVQKQPEHTSATQAELQQELTLQQATLALTQNDIPRTLSLAQELSPMSPAHKTNWGRFIDMRQRVLLSAAYRANGDMQAAEDVLLETMPATSTDNDRTSMWLAITNLTDLYEAQGKLRKLGQIYDSQFDSLEWQENPSPLFVTLAHLRHATLLYEWDRLEEADAAAQSLKESGQGLELPYSIPVFAIFSIWTQARVARAQGKHIYARQLLESEELDPTRWQIPELNQTLGIFSTRLALFYDRLEQAELWASSSRLHFADQLKAPLKSNHYMGYITLVRILLARRRLQHDPTALTQALTLLDNLRRVATETDFHGWLVEIQMLTALALQAQGKTRQALATLGQLLTRAEPEGYVRIFADEGAAMAHLLAQVATYTSASTGYLKRLQTALVPAPDPSPDTQETQAHQPAIDPLSAREQEVLQLLATGYSNQQIADRLVISLNTAKRHVKHILSKLTVTNRTQALVRARELHLL